MKPFEKIRGHEDIKRYFMKAIDKGQLAHSYIFEGIEGVGKKTIAKELTKLLLCEDEDKPCGQCSSCIQIESGNHPDITYINKDGKTTKIDTIREKVVKDMEIKPFGPYKIMVVTEADTVTIEGQNAMLKTIEEPPHYGIVILITQNLSKLLPTIESRCIHIKFNPLGKEAMLHYLEGKGLTNEQRMVYTQFSEGSIGMAHRLMEDEIFLELRQKSIQYLEKLREADLIKLYDLVKEICDDKDNITRVLGFWEIWYRDMMLLKSTGSTELYYLDYKGALLDMSSKLTYNTIGKHIDCIKEAIIQIKQNIYATFVIENLLLSLKERKK